MTYMTTSNRRTISKPRRAYWACWLHVSTQQGNAIDRGYPAKRALPAMLSIFMQVIGRVLENEAECARSVASASRSRKWRRYKRIGLDGENFVSNFGKYGKRKSSVWFHKFPSQTALQMARTVKAEPTRQTSEWLGTIPSMSWALSNFGLCALVSNKPRGMRIR